MLMRRPVLTPDAAPYWTAFLDLSRDRPMESLSLGMAGGVSLPRPVPRETIRREGERRGFAGDSLDDFVEIVVGIDDAFVEITLKAESARLAAAARQNRKG